MAKVPRIEQGDRPSGTYSPTIDASVQAMVGSVADVSETLLKEATAAERAEQQRMAEALAQKQKIVDESNAGRVSMEFEGDHFKTLAELESGYADTPEKIPALYTEIMRERAEAIRLREDINDNVKLSATKSAESTMSSGLRQAYSISSALQTKQVKGNLAKSRIEFTGSAIGQRSPEAVQALADKFTAQERGNFVAAFGAEADAQMQKAVSEAYLAWGKNFTHEHPDEYLAADKTLIKGNIPEHYTELDEGARSSLKGMLRRNLNDTFVSAVRRGSEVTTAYAEGTLDIPTILSSREAWKAQIDAILLNPGLTPEQKKTQTAPITRELEVLKITEDMLRSEMKAEAIPDDELPAEITMERQRIFGRDKKSRPRAKSLDELLEYKKMLTVAHLKKNISPGTYATLVKEADLSMTVTVNKERKNTWSLFSDTPKQIGNAKLDDLFDVEKPKAPDIERNRATVKFVGMYNAAVAAGKTPTAAEAEKMAEDAFRLAYGAAPIENKGKK